jgi:hypothetical protein
MSATEQRFFNESSYFCNSRSEDQSSSLNKKPSFRLADELDLVLAHRKFAIDAIAKASERIVIGQSKVQTKSKLDHDHKKYCFLQLI